MTTTESYEQILQSLGFEGELPDKLQSTYLKAIADNIGSGSSTSDEIPTFYNDEYATTKATVEALSTNDSFNIICATDLHYSPKGSGYNESKLRVPVFNMLKALRKAEKEMPVSLVAVLGDYMQMPEEHTKEDGISNIAELNAGLSSITSPKMAICGNHEYDFKGNGSGSGLTNDELYQYLLKKYVGRDIKKASTNVFYMFDDVNEVCYLFISANNNANVNTYLQAAFNNVITANTNNYPYMVLCHFAVDTVNDTLWAGVADAIDYIKTTKGKSIIAWIGGHKHCDWVKVYNDTLVVSLLNSCYYANNPSQDGETYEKPLGTADESAFSIITINKTFGKLYVTRFGAGVDIECNYNSTSGAIGRVEESPSQDYWFNVDDSTISQYASNHSCEYNLVGNTLSMTVNDTNSGVKIDNIVSELPTSEKKTLKLIADSCVGTEDLFVATVDFYEGTTKVGSVGMLGSKFEEKVSTIGNGGITRTISSSVLATIGNADKVEVVLRSSSATSSDLPNLPYNLSFVNLRVELS